MWRFTFFFLTSFSQPGPAGTIHLNQTKKNTGTHNTWMNEIQKRKTMWRFNFFCELVSTARMFQNTYLKETGEKTWQPCGVLSCFFMIRLHGQDLPEAYSRMSGKKEDHCQNLPEAYTWMRYKKKVKTLWRFNFFLWIDFHSKNLPEPYTSMRPKNTGKPCGVLSFFVVHLHSQHVPAEWETKTKTKLKPSRSLSLHGTMGPEKTRKTMWRSNFFCELIFTTRTFQTPTQKKSEKSMCRFNPLGGLIFTAKTLQKPTPAWQQNHAAFYLFFAVTFTPTSFQKPTPQREA